MSHTPGPWSVEKRFSEETGSAHYAISNPSFDAPCRCGARHPSGRLIAWMSGGLGDVQHRPELWRNDPEAEADARLIAAAPDLLREAKEALALLEDMEASDNPACDPEGNQASNFFMTKAALERAIAKAKGRS